MNKISVFEHPEFGRIRTLDIDGKIWFCASDIASALGYANPRDAVARHCKPIGVAIYDTPTRSAVQKIKYINEGNVYRLIAGSKLPAAEKFESWIFDELVPETLKNGGYILERTAKRTMNCWHAPCCLRRAKSRPVTSISANCSRQTALPF